MKSNNSRGHELSCLLVVPVLLGLAMLLPHGSALAAWTSPSTTPPSGNVAAPINVSSVDQAKLGSLTIGGEYLEVSTGNLLIPGGNRGVFWNSTADLTEPHINFGGNGLYLSPGSADGRWVELQGNIKITDASPTNLGNLLLDGGLYKSDGTTKFFADTCAGADQSIKTINADGTVTCEADNGGAGGVYLAENGLTLTVDKFGLGGLLNRNTTINQGDFSYTYNLDGAGDFLIQDSGVNRFEVRDDGGIYLSNILNCNGASTLETTATGLISCGEDASSGATDSLWQYVIKSIDFLPYNFLYTKLSPTDRLRIGHDNLAEADNLTQLSVKNNSTNSTIYAEQSFPGGLGYAGYFSGRTVFMNGNVGIGNTQPTELFTVGNSEGLKIDSSGNPIKIRAVTYSWPDTQGANNTFLRNDGSGNLTWTAAGGDTLWEGTAGTAINPKQPATTKVGIGQTAPAAKLTINYGTADVGSASDAVGLYANTAGSGLYVQQGGSGFSGYFSGKAAFMNGNVGIGNSNPLERLHVTGNVRVSSLAGGACTGNGTVDADANGTLFCGADQAGAGGGLVGAGTATQVAFWTTDNTALGGDNSLYWNNTTKRLGVGTNSPSQKLTAYGTGGSPATSGTTQNGIFRIHTSDDAVLDVGVLAASPWSTWLQATDAADLASIYPLSLNPNGGNVGIGTTNPANIFSVGSSSQFQVSIQGNISRIRDIPYTWPGIQGAANAYLMNNGSGGLSWTVPAVLPSGVAGQTLRHSGASWVANSFLYNNGANVGIGTTSPTTRLMVVGATTTDQLALGQGGEGYLRLGTDNNDNTYIAGNASHRGSGVWNYVNTDGYGQGATRLGITNSFTFNTASGGVNPITWTERMRITNDGKVGVDNDTPSALLTVSKSGATGYSSNHTLTANNNASANYDAIAGFKGNSGSSVNGSGVYGELVANSNCTGTCAGIYGSVGGNTGAGEWAGYFDGPVNIAGTLTVNGGTLGIQCPPRRVIVNERSDGWDEWIQYETCSVTSSNTIKITNPRICDSVGTGSRCVGIANVQYGAKWSCADYGLSYENTSVGGGPDGVTQIYYWMPSSGWWEYNPSGNPLPYDTISELHCKLGGVQKEGTLGP